MLAVGQGSKGSEESLNHNATLVMGLLCTAIRQSPPVVLGLYLAVQYARTRSVQRNS